MRAPFSAYRGDEPFVFVCYAHEDAEVVYSELQRLHDSGVNIWYDEGIAPGQEWTQETADAIEGSSQFLNFVSPASVASRHCRNEIQFALEHETTLVSVYLEPTELPGGLKLTLGLAQAIMKHEMSADAYEHKLSDALHVPDAPRERAPEPVSVGRWPRWSMFLAVFVTVVLLSVAGIWWAQQPGAPATNESADAADSSLAVAVMPFVNMSNDPEQEYFSDGIAEDILNELARNTSLAVRPRASAFALKDADLDLQAIGARLDVTHVLGGSVRRSGERVRVTVQLSEVGRNRSVWSDRYDRELTDIFAVQDEIAGEVLRALNAQLGRDAAPRAFVSGEAYEAFLLGRHYINRFDVIEAIRWFEVATELDPTNADAWAHLARINALLAYGGVVPNSEESRRERTNYVDRALAIDPTHPNALAIKAWWMFIVDRDYQASIDQLAEVVRANPNDPLVHMWLAMVLKGIGRDALAIQASSRFVELDPSPNQQGSHVVVLAQVGATEEARQALEAYRGGWTNPAVQDAMAFARFHVAWAEGDKTVMQAAVSSPSMFANPISSVLAALVPYLHGDHEAAHELLAPLTESTEYVSHYVQSRAAMIEGRFDTAVRHWREAILAGEPLAVLEMSDTSLWRKTFPELYKHPGYQQMLVDYGLDAESRSKITVPDLPF